MNRPDLPTADRRAEEGAGARATGWLSGALPIQSHHLDRMAVVYVGQSTQQQVAENRELTARQYDLVRRAVELGWHPDRVLVIDEDQGCSGRTSEGRLGFQRLLAEVGLDHVGLVLGLEMSRLARSCKDWHQLPELCALFRTLLADQDGLYDPADFNDRPLLGLKGTMSEAEVHILRSRMEQGRRNKARRGELFSHMPIGYLILPSGEVATDPDEQARDVVRLVFDKFDELGSVAGVVRHLQGHDIRLGVRPTSGSNRGQLEWSRASRITVRNMLRHPIYAGAYSYRRNAVDPRRKTPGRKKSGCRALPREEWLALQGTASRPTSPGNSTSGIWSNWPATARAAWGVPRVGPSLLAGLVYCGRCGRRMRVISGKPQRPRYHCLREGEGFPPPTCQGLMAVPLDELVGRQALAVLEPTALELSLKAAEDVLQDRHRLHGHRRQRLERAAVRRRAGGPPIPRRRAREPPGGPRAGGPLGAGPAGATPAPGGVRPVPVRCAGGACPRKTGQRSGRWPRTCPRCGMRPPRR